MADYEAIGVLKFVAQVHTEDEIDEYWDRFNGRVEAYGVEAFDGTYVGTNIYETFPDVAAAKQEEVAQISAKSNKLMAKSTKAVAERQVAILDEEVGKGSAEYIGEMPDDEASRYREEHPNQKLQAIGTYDDNGHFLPGSREVYRILGVHPTEQSP
jgi:hypothetical protein